MTLQQTTIQELKEIVQEEFGEELSKDTVEKLAYSLVGYFNLLLKAEVRNRKNEFGNSSVSRIDNKLQKKENDES